MMTIMRLVRWFGKVLDRDGIGWAGFWISVLVAFIFGCMAGCMEKLNIVNQYETKLGNFRDEAVRRGEMEVWHTPDGENVYKWKE